MHDIIVQLIGAIAFLFLIWSYQKKKKVEILVLQIISAIIFSIHYYFLNAATAVFCNIINCIVFLLIYFYEKKNKNKLSLFVIMIPLLIIISLISWDGISSILPIIASIIVLIGFLLNNENDIRLIGIISSLCWLIYGLIYISYSAIIFNAVTIITTSLAIKKHKK